MTVSTTGPAPVPQHGSVPLDAAFDGQPTCPHNHPLDCDCPCPALDTVTVTGEHTFDHLSPPPGATRVYAPQQNHAGRWYREFTGATWRTAGILVVIEGEQLDDGTAQRHLTVLVDDLPATVGGELTASQARQLIVQLGDAIDALAEAGR